MALDVAFAGTPDFAATVLQGILDSEHRVKVVVSQPDARRGRGRKLHPPPVAELARLNGLPLLQPESSSEAAGLISCCDVLVVAAYGQILRADTLFAASHDAWNIHASLLPEYRGAAPVERAIMDGKPETGITIMKMDEGLDTGDMALKRNLPISDDMDAGTLTVTLAKLGANAIVEVLSMIEDGTVTLTSQDSLDATYASKVSSEDQALCWSRSAVELHNRVRALSPRIGARAYHDDIDGPMKIWRTKVVPELDFRHLSVGEIYVDCGKIYVGCGEGELQVLELQIPGGKKMLAEDLLRGRGIGGALRSEARPLE